MVWNLTYVHGYKEAIESENYPTSKLIYNFKTQQKDKYYVI